MMSEYHKKKPSGDNIFAEPGQFYGARGKTDAENK